MVENRNQRSPTHMVLSAQPLTVHCPLRGRPASRGAGRGGTPSYQGPPFFGSRVVIHGPFVHLPVVMRRGPKRTYINSDFPRTLPGPRLSKSVLVSKCLIRVYTVAKLTLSNHRQLWKNIWRSALRSQGKGKRKASSAAIKFQRISRSVSQMPHQCPTLQSTKAGPCNDV
jgi:hypothetical protein